MSAGIPAPSRATRATARPSWPTPSARCSASISTTTPRSTCQGMVHVVNAVGGIDVNVDHALCDARYDEYGYQGYSIGAGRHHMGGERGAGLCPDPQVGRRERLHPGRPPAAGRRRPQGPDRPGRLPRRPDRAHPGARRHRRDERPAEPSSATWHPLATQIGPKDIYRVVVGHPYVRPGYDARGSIQLPDLKKIAVLGASLFTTPGTRPAATSTSPRHRPRGPRARPSRRRTARWSTRPRSPPRSRPGSRRRSRGDARADRVADTGTDADRGPDADRAPTAPAP